MKKMCTSSDCNIKTPELNVSYIFFGNLSQNKTVIFTKLKHKQV